MQQRRVERFSRPSALGRLARDCWRGGRVKEGKNGQERGRRKKVKVEVEEGRKATYKEFMNTRLQLESLGWKAAAVAGCCITEKLAGTSESAYN